MTKSTTCLQAWRKEEGTLNGDHSGLQLQTWGWSDGPNLNAQGGHSVLAGTKSSLKHCWTVKLGFDRLWGLDTVFARTTEL
mmetsp:Transcript_35487/g.66089  ORF Transcript_35487/g.66089 Transcript_35487/m.66089 type:complete len:81 (-) Transcript_35487:278-520(-)